MHGLKTAIKENYLQNMFILPQESCNKYLVCSTNHLRLHVLLNFITINFREFDKIIRI